MCWFCAVWDEFHYLILEKNHFLYSLQIGHLRLITINDELMYITESKFCWINPTHGSG